MNFLLDRHTLLIIICIIIVVIVLMSKIGKLNYWKFLNREKPKEIHSENNKGVSLINSKVDKINMNINNTSIVNDIRDAAIRGELVKLPFRKRLIIYNDGDKDAINVDFICSDLEEILNVKNKSDIFPIKRIISKSSVEFGVIFYTTSSSMYKVDWIWEDMYGNKKTREQIMTC